MNTGKYIDKQLGAAEASLALAHLETRLHPSLKDVHDAVCEALDAVYAARTKLTETAHPDQGDNER